MVRERLQIDPEEWQAFVGTWATEGTHPMLPGDEIRGRTSFEWLDGQRFLIQRTHYEHPRIPDAIAIIGVTDGLAMHYFDSRGVHRVYAVSLEDGVLQLALDGPDFSQRLTLTVSDADTITAQGQLMRDGRTWEDDLSLTYRRMR